MNILFIGGSNLVIKKGLTTFIPEILAQNGVDIEHTYNISVGATTSLFGLENLSLFLKKDIDLIFIEYGINDLPLFVNDKSLWEQSFTSLLLLAKERYPSAHIVTILLGRQKERFWKSQSSMHQRMKNISEKAGALVVNIDTILKSKSEFFPNFEEFYLDDSHYQSPHVTKYLSSLIVSEYLISSQLEKINQKHHKKDEKKELSVYRAPGKVACFENSRFLTQTSIIKSEETIEIAIKGNPVAVSFISAINSSSLLIETSTTRKIINTKRKKSTLGKFSFILKQIPLYGIYNKEDHKKENIIRLTAIGKNSENWDGSIEQKTYGMEPAVVDKSSCVYMSHISSL